MLSLGFPTWPIQREVKEQLCECSYMWVCVLQTQEREARENMKRKAKELQQQRRDIAKGGGRRGIGIGGGFGSGSSDHSSSPHIDSMSSMEPSKPTYQAPRWVQSLEGILQGKEEIRIVSYGWTIFYD